MCLGDGEMKCQEGPHLSPFSFGSVALGLETEAHHPTAKDRKINLGRGEESTLLEPVVSKEPVKVGTFASFKRNSGFQF